ncbi:unnamed protein product [Aphanomyces euteiches]|uniref:Cysteine/serine-rich nuclear protein N-terminal domain-containing protein n=1 Tax=Aphanomyces euteiches TaxID=100861 RepID=A0A6G0XGB2_9STRA|nr:hypothetical protein Ae201684_005071 [Aphanomyces euteiches]KAH9082388.1 hypothetical protein Ae201684P_009713 [Aphanomyces euteiches]KAH9143644.1 hypothetical protein AeRB84_012378 [Aphanomyces euteiches]
MLSYDNSNEEPSAMAKRVATTLLSPTSVDELRRDLAQRRRHRVTFSTATTFEFPVAFGASALPKERGPPVGMTQIHSNMCTTDISNNSECKRGVVMKFANLERMDLLKAASVDAHEIAVYCREAAEIRQSRQEAAHEEHRARRRKREAASALLQLAGYDMVEPSTKRRRVLHVTNSSA